MKRLFAFAVAGVIALGAASVYAGGGCCAAGKAKSEAKAGRCADMFAKYNLTDEQKTKFAALEAECDKTGCTEASHAKMMSGAKEILTPEQYSQWQADCDKAKAGGQCPYMKSASAKDGKQG